jgi:hypothetical protein
MQGANIDPILYEEGHIQKVLAELELTFPKYFEKFFMKEARKKFQGEIESYLKEQAAYEEYMDLETLKEFEFDPNAFKGETRSQCPIVRRCLGSQEEYMKSYKRSFNSTTGRTLLDTVTRIAQFGQQYVNTFDHTTHEAATSVEDLQLSTLNEGEYFAFGVIGYGVQSSLLYGLYPYAFAHRSQNAMWALYFMTNHKDFGCQDASEFLQVKVDTCEQNYFYPADLFGFYSLKLFLLLKEACVAKGLVLLSEYRYIYLSAFSSFVGEIHTDDKDALKRSSTDVESQPWF